MRALLVLASFGTDVAAQPSPPRDLFLTQPAGAAVDGPRLAGSGAAVLRQRLARIDYGILATARLDAARTAAEPTVLRLNLFDDVVLHTSVGRTGPTSAGYWLSGRIRGLPLGSMTLVVNGDVVVGSVSAPGAAYAIRSVGGGMHAVRQVDPATLLPRHDDLLRLASPPPEPAARRLVSSPSPLAAHPAVDVSPAEDGSRVDALVVYTPAARDAEGGHKEIQALIDLYVAETNQAFADSGVFLRLNLVLASMVDYEEASPEGNFYAGSVDLGRLVWPDDDHLDEVHGLRDRYAADIVTFVGHYTDGTGGIAASWCTGNAPLRGCAPEAWMGFNLVDHEVSSLTFAHELGHTMGLNHDRYAATRCPRCRPLPEQDLAKWEPRPYAFGYVNQRALKPDAPEASRWVTLMAYRDQCWDAGIWCSTLFRFSNPDQTYFHAPNTPGDPMGIAGDKRSSSLTGPADARRTLNETRRIVANFRVGPPNLPPARVGMLAPLTVRLDKEAVTVEVSGAFRDPDGDALTYEAASSAPAVATAGVAGSEVAVTAVSAGEATVTVTATDTGGLSAMQLFRVSVTAAPAGPPEAAFTVDAACAGGLCRARTGVAVRFTDTSTGQVDSRMWDFGQGGSVGRSSIDYAWAEPGFYEVTLTVTDGSRVSMASKTFLIEAAEPRGTCVADAETLCLRDSRYSVTVDWRATGGEGGEGRVVHAGTNDSGMFHFFDPNNWEVLVKVVDGCALNGHVWVFGASTTDLGYSVQVTDTASGTVQEYGNDPGMPAAAITDVTAFMEGCRR